LEEVYGKLVEGIGRKASFLLNLDVLYWFPIGRVAGASFAVVVV